MKEHITLVLPKWLYFRTSNAGIEWYDVDGRHLRGLKISDLEQLSEEKTVKVQQWIRPSDVSRGKLREETATDWVPRGNLRAIYLERDRKPMIAQCTVGLL